MPKPKYTAPDPAELSVKALVEVVHKIQEALWYDSEYHDNVWNPDKEWSADTNDRIAGVLSDAGLAVEATDA